MTGPTYLLSSLVWSAGGFLLGFLLGRATCTLRAIDRKISMDTDVDDNADQHDPVLKPGFSRHPRFDRLLGVVLIGLAVLSVVGVGVQVRRLNDVTSCQAEWNDSYTEALRQRSEAAATERRAQRELITAILRPSTPGQAQAALERYLNSLNDADQERQAAPIPSRHC